MKPKILALYLPQFYPFPENDKWWGKGFTEWTNVGKAKSLFKGHYQPRVPADLGYYDLRLPIIREQQAELAREAGVTAFCYWHYWFGNGKRLLADVFQEVLESGKPDFPFCLAWANHTWKAVGCTADYNGPGILIEQTYPGIADAKAHFKFLLKAFKDERYLKIEGKPFLFIFNPVELPKIYIDYFKEATLEAGFPGLFLAANCGENNIKKEDMLAKGFDTVTYSNLFGHAQSQESLINKIGKNLKAIILRHPKNCFDYSKMMRKMITEIDRDTDVIPQIMPQWDHSPRSGQNAVIFTGSTPEKFEVHLRDALEAIKNKPEERQILMLKSWNEWAEGNYMEPDLKYGKRYIQALRQILNEYRDK